MSRGLNFIGQYWGCLGIPNHTRDFAEALINNMPVSIIPIQPNSNNDQYGLTDNLVSNIQPHNPENDNLVFWYPHTYEHYLKQIPTHSTAQEVPAKNIGYYIFEYTIIPPAYLEAIAKMDAICTASEWGAKVLKDNGVTIPIHVIPGGVRHDYFNSEARDLDEKRFKFLHMGKAENRKGTEIVIRAFNEAFRGDRKVRLSLFIDNPHRQDFDADMFLHNIHEDYKLQYPVSNIDVRHFEDDSRAIYNTHQVAVFASKAEGIGLPIVEAMSCGLPVIVPFNSGITQYATDENTILLKNLVSEPVFDSQFFSNSGEYGDWNAPTVEELTEKMVWCYENWEEANNIGAQAEEDMKTKYTWDISAKKFINEVLVR